MTQKTLDKLPEKVRKQIERYKNAYRLTDNRLSVVAYLHGLEDADVITQYESKILFSYITL